MSETCGGTGRVPCASHVDFTHPCPGCADCQPLTFPHYGKTEPRVSETCKGTGRVPNVGHQTTSGGATSEPCPGCADCQLLAEPCAEWPDCTHKEPAVPDLLREDEREIAERARVQPATFVGVHQIAKRDVPLLLIRLSEARAALRELAESSSEFRMAVDGYEDHLWSKRLEEDIQEARKVLADE